MTQLKTQEDKDIDATNRIMANIRPYLFLEQEITDFVAKRMLAQAEEIRTKGLKSVALGTIYYSLNNPELGSELMEEALRLRPQDWITWRQYSLCGFWRCGPIEAREITRRSTNHVVSPLIARDALFYAMNTGDFEFMRDMYSLLIKTNTLEEVFSSGYEKERGDMENGMNYLELAEKTGKSEIIKHLAGLMYDELNLGQKLQAVNHLIDVSEYADETSLLYELHVPSLESHTCAAMNLNLIAKRVQAGLVDWEVGAVFVSEPEEGKADACNA
ncbi:TPA: hypothetical protein N5O02_002459 [Enterobacter asburiae]|nr:hypothetical protein [Enterobacter asburiae]